MKQKRIIMVVSFLLVWLVAAGVGTFAATTINRALNASVRIVSNPNFSFYSDQAGTQAIAAVSFPDVAPGGTSTFVTYIKNITGSNETLTAGAHTIPANVGTLTMTFDSLDTKTLAPGAISQLVATLHVLSTAPPTTLNFTMSVDVALVTVPTTTTTTPTTSTTTSTTTTVALNGQQIFTANCTSCHGVPSTSYTQAQLLTFIPSHNTGRNLTAAQVAAIAAYLKP